MEKIFEKVITMILAIICFVFFYTIAGVFYRIENDSSSSRKKAIPIYAEAINIISVREITDSEMGNYFDIIYIDRDSKMNERIELDANDVSFSISNRYRNLCGCIRYLMPNGYDKKIISITIGCDIDTYNKIIRIENTIKNK